MTLPIIDVYESPTYPEALRAQKRGMVHKGTIIENVALCGIHGIEFVRDDRLKYDRCRECEQLALTGERRNK